MTWLEYQPGESQDKPTELPNDVSTMQYIPRRLTRTRFDPSFVHICFRGTYTVTYPGPTTKEREQKDRKKGHQVQRLHLVPCNRSRKREVWRNVM